MKIARQRGFGLVELMVATAISLFLITGLLSVFLASRQTDRAQDAQSRIQENARYAFEALGRGFRKAGFRQDPYIELAIVFPVGGGFAVGQVLAGTDTSVSFRYQGSVDGLTEDCLGAATAAGAIVTETLSVSGGSLQCAATGGAQAVVEGVDGLHLTYGVDTNGDGSADQYSTAASVTSGGNWPRVVALRVELLMASLEDHVATSQQTYSFNQTTVTATDYRLRRTYGTVIAKRN